MYNDFFIENITLINRFFLNKQQIYYLQNFIIFFNFLNISNIIYIIYMKYKDKKINIYKMYVHT